MRRLLGDRSRRAVLVAVAVAALGLHVPAGAEEEGPLPDSCTVHPVHIVNPGCVPALGDRIGEATGPLLEPPETYPDLVPDVRNVFAYRPVVGFDRTTSTLTWGRPELRFDTWAQNLGAVALDLVSDEPTNVENPAVSQCVAWTLDVCRERRQVGGFELHPTHNHFHFNDFARYELRSLLPDGTPDYSAAGLLDVSDKVSFCLVDSARVRPDARPVQTYVLCTVTREGISAGWADIYTSDLTGQQLSPPGGLVDGRYALVIRIDDGGHVFETNDDNNVVELTVEVSADATSAAILDRRWP